MIVSLIVRHFKVYKGIKFIPLTNGSNFISFVGDNGVGKSSILEALDTFFNGGDWNINKSALSDGIGIENTPFIAVTFLIEKTSLARSKNRDFLESISDYFWQVEKKSLTPGVQGSMKDFFSQRDELKRKYSNENYFLFIVGEEYQKSRIFFSSFQREESFRKILFKNSNVDIDGDKSEEWLDNKLNELYKDFLPWIKKQYSYIYIPVEKDLENFTKIVTDEMQKLMNKNTKKEIEKKLESIDIDKINVSLDSFIEEIEIILDKKYSYNTGDKSKKSLTKKDLVEKILEVYFSVRVLLKNHPSGNKKEKVSISKLSSGEKRQALIDVVYAFIKRGGEREGDVILAIDEPEASLHNSACFEQFEKLKNISEQNQIIVTTHWYGFLPVAGNGIAHFLEISDNLVNFESYDLMNYRERVRRDVKETKNNIPKNFILKSTNDLVQSIYYSIQKENNYNWLVCEGLSEKVYFEFFFEKEIKENKLVILPVGGKDSVVKIYEYLKLPVREHSKLLGKVYCLIDTDEERFREDISDNDNTSILRIRRLINRDNNVTELVTLSNSITGKTEIENCLNPKVFKETLKFFNNELSEKVSIKNAKNTDFVKALDLKSSDARELDSLLNSNTGHKKVDFANKYVEIMKTKYLNKKESVTPNWIDEIKDFYKII